MLFRPILEWSSLRLNACGHSIGGRPTLPFVHASVQIACVHVQFKQSVDGFDLSLFILQFLAAGWRPRFFRHLPARKPISGIFMQSQHVPHINTLLARCAMNGTRADGLSSGLFWIGNFLCRNSYVSKHASQRCNVVPVPMSQMLPRCKGLGSWSSTLKQCSMACSTVCCLVCHVCDVCGILILVQFW